MKKNEFEKNSLLLFVLMMGSNVCNYLFQILTGRMMEVSDYGTLNSLLAVIAIFSTPGSIITMITARYVSIGKVIHDKERVFSAFGSVMKATIVFIGMIVLSGLFLSSGIAAILRIQNKFYIIYCFIIACVFLLNAPFSGTFQGLQKFFRYGLQTCIPSIFKLIFGIVLVRKGLRVFGALSGVMAGNILTLVYSIFAIYSFFGHEVLFGKSRRIRLEDLRGFVSGTIIAQLCIALVSNCDILLVKAFFTGKEAGIYSSGMVIAKIAMYISGAVVAALFPIVAERCEKGEETKSIFTKALLYGGGASILCSIVMSLFGTWIIEIMFGNKYKAGISLLPFISIYIVPVTFLTIIMNYVLARCKAKLFSFSMLTGIIGGILTAVFIHHSLESMIVGMGVVMWLVVAVNLIEIYGRRG